MRQPSAMEIRRARMDRAWERARDQRNGRTLSESPLEEHLRGALLVVVTKGVSVEQQARVAGYRMDFVLRGGDAAIAIECDGKEFHRRSADRPRERHVLRTGAIERIYRLPGYAAFHAVDACLVVVASLDPWVFAADSACCNAGERLRQSGRAAFGGAEIFELPPSVRSEREWQLSWGAETQLDDSVVTVASNGSLPAPR